MPEIGRICYAYRDIIQREPSLAKYNHRESKKIEEYEDFVKDLEETDVHIPELNNYQDQSSVHNKII